MWCAMAERGYSCPICRQIVAWKGNGFRPFCSERCRLIDLQGWLGERYRVPDSEEPNLDDLGTDDIDSDLGIKPL